MTKCKNCIQEIPMIPTDYARNGFCTEECKYGWLAMHEKGALFSLEERATERRRQKLEDKKLRDEIQDKFDVEIK